MWKLGGPLMVLPFEEVTKQCMCKLQVYEHQHFKH